MASSFQARGLRRAARLYGEPQVLAILRVPPSVLDRWTRGLEPVPPELFLKVINLLAAAEAGLGSPP